MTDNDAILRGQADAPDRFRVIFEMEIEVTDWEKLRDRQVALQYDEEGTETLSVPPTKHWSNAVSPLSERLYLGNQNDEGVRVLSSSAIPRFLDENGVYPEIRMIEM